MTVVAASPAINLYYDSTTQHELDAAMLLLKDVAKPKLHLVELEDKSTTDRVADLAGCRDLPLVALDGVVCSGIKSVMYMAASVSDMLPADPVEFLQTAQVLEFYCTISETLSKADMTDGPIRDRVLTQTLPPLLMVLENTFPRFEEPKLGSGSVIECCVTALFRMLTSEELYLESDFRTFYPKMTKIMEDFKRRQPRAGGVCGVCRSS